MKRFSDFGITNTDPFRGYRKIEIEEEDEDERVYDEDGSIFKTKAWKKIWDKICLALLILAFLIPVGLLAYIILQFFK